MIKKNKNKINVPESIDNINIENIQTGLALAASMVQSVKVSRIIAGVSASVAIGKSVWDYRSSHKEKRKFTIRINESDKLYAKVQSWLIESIPPSDQKSVIISSKRADSGASRSEIEDLVSDSNVKRDNFLSVYYDGERTQVVSFAGDTIEITMSSEQKIESLGATSSKTTNSRSIVISCSSLKTRDAVLAMLTEDSRKAYERRPQFWMAQKWGNFRNASEIPVRTEESVVLKAGQKELILNFLRKFLEQETAYVNLGIPWHTGILLYGPPGSGKTSIATTLAHTLNLDIHYISLSSVEDDNALLELLGDVSPKSILLLEDIDVARAATERDDTRSGVTLSGLLNGLDGITTPHGIITIMTTNHYESLDPALIRPGRVDISEEIGYVTSEQITRLCTQFIGYIPVGLPIITIDDKIVASEIIDVFKANLDDLDNVGPTLVATLESKLLKSIEDMTNEAPKKKSSPRK